MGNDGEDEQQEGADDLTEDDDENEFQEETEEDDGAGEGEGDETQDEEVEEVQSEDVRVVRDSHSYRLVDHGSCEFDGDALYASRSGERSLCE